MFFHKTLASLIMLMNLFIYPSINPSRVYYSTIIFFYSALQHKNKYKIFDRQDQCPETIKSGFSSENFLFFISKFSKANFFRNHQKFHSPPSINALTYISTYSYPRELFFALFFDYSKTSISEHPQF